jgi:DNA-binding MarR family transcriptional regulator
VPERISFLLHRLVRGMDLHADRVLRTEFGVTVNEFAYIAVLAEDGELDLTTLAGRMRVTKAAVSKRVPALQHRGLLHRRADPSNARRVLVSATKNGLTLVEQAGERLESGFSQMCSTEELDDHGVIDADRLRADLHVLQRRIWRLVEG